MNWRNMSCVDCGSPMQGKAKQERFEGKLVVIFKCSKGKDKIIPKHHPIVRVSP